GEAYGNGNDRIVFAQKIMRPEVLLPGETVSTEHSLDNLIIGPGLVQGSGDGEGMVVQAVKAGLVNEANSILYLDNPQKRYLPQVGEPVVGVVAGKMGDGWKIDIRGPQAAYLDSLAFEGATKRNKPSLAIGSLVYGRITIANRDMDPEMECVGLSSKSEGFGELGTEGTVATLSLPMSRRFDAAAKLVV
ncbi:exosome non-catalytic core subunit rrp40, partial [Kappamyces sp. JEL0680]